MHQFAVAQSLIEAATAEAARLEAVRVTRLSCRIGAMRQIDGWLMNEAFAIAAAGTICASAALSIEKTYMQATCRACRRRFPIRDWIWTCPTCGAEGENPTGGDELALVSLDADVADMDKSEAPAADGDEQ